MLLDTLSPGSVSPSVDDGNPFQNDECVDTVASASAATAVVSSHSRGLHALDARVLKDRTDGCCLMCDVLDLRPVLCVCACM